jgi:hypothetical protein
MLLKDTFHAGTIKSIMFDCCGWSSGYSQAMTIINQYNIDKKRDNENKHIIDVYEKILFFINNTKFIDNKTLKKQLKTLLQSLDVADYIIKTEIKRINNLVF